MSWFSVITGSGGEGNFEKAEDIQAGDNADLNGAVFAEVTHNEDGTVTLHVVTADDDFTYTKPADAVIFCPKP